MKKIEFNFDSLDGNYNFISEFDDNSVTFEINTDIVGLDSKSGTLDNEKIKFFNDKVSSLNIYNWQNSYELIEDAVKYRVIYEDNSIKYICNFSESFEPYEYELLVETISLCDDKAKYFSYHKE